MTGACLRRVSGLCVLVLGGLLVASYFKFRRQASEVPASPEPPELDGVERFRIDSPDTYFSERGFVEMVPPLRLPASSVDAEVVVWLRIPQGQLIHTWFRSGRVLLELPAGAEAARVERSVSQDRVLDVRGTRFTPTGERFFVARPAHPTVDSLDGWRWRRDSPEEQAVATLYIAEHDAQSSAPALRDAQRRSIIADNDCASCHVYGRLSNERSDQYGKVNRGTDLSGCFQVQNVLSSRLPVETYFPLERNTQDPFIHFDCNGAAADAGAGRPAQLGEERVSCADDAVPYGTLDVRAALAAGDKRVRRLCAARRYLYQRLDDAGVSAFREGFAECGITSGGD